MKYSILLVFSITIGVFSIISFQIHSANAETISPLLTFGSPGSGPGQFNIPRGIVVDSSGNIYVADNNNFRIEKFNTQGTFLLSFSPTRTQSPPAGGAEGIAVDSSDNIYVTDKQNQRLEKYSPSGTLLSSFTPRIPCNCTIYNTPNGTMRTSYSQAVVERVAIDSWGNLYVTGSDIIKLNSKGAFQSQFFAHDNGNCCLLPEGITIDSSDNIYVADMENHRILKFNSTGSILLSIGSSVLHTAQAGSPQDVAVDSSGNIFVADTYNGRIIKFNSTGSLVSSIGISGVPVGIVIDKSGKIYVNDLANDQVKVYSTSQFGTNTSTSVTPQKQPINLNDNSTALSLAIKLATSSPKFQSMIQGYNYSFSSDFEVSGPLHTGGIGVTTHGFAFELYQGPIELGKAVKVVNVMEDPTLSKILDVVSYPAEYHGGLVHSALHSPPSSVTNPDKPDVISEIDGWSGSSISDTALLNDLSITGNHIPSWLKKVAKWVADGQISEDDFVNAIKYMDENGIVK